jgi:hypothetical protein
MSGVSFSHTRCSTPRRCSTAYQPSGAWRSIPAVNSPSLRLTLMSAPNGGAGRTGITVGNTSGAQNTICSEKDWSGLAPKTQPPSLAELGTHSGGLRNAVMVSLIVRIATQAFPGKSGNLCILSAVVAVRRPPINLRHSRPHFVLGNCVAIFLISKGCGSPRLYIARCIGRTFDAGRSFFQRALKTYAIILSWRHHRRAL